MNLRVSLMAAELDEMVEGFRARKLDAGPYTFLWIDALTQKVREGGRTVNVHALIATAVSAGGRREIPGIEVASSEDGAGWLAFLRGLVARGLSGVALVTSDCHQGLRDAIASVLPAPHGSGAGLTTIATCSPECPSPPSRGCPPWSGLSSGSPAPPRCAPSTPRS
jgi:putative transposase